MSKKSFNKRLQWKAEVIGFKAMEQLLRPWSLSSLYLIGELLGTIFYRFSTSYRAIVRRNLAVMMSDTGLANPSSDQVEEVFRRNGGNMLTTIASGVRKQRELDQCLELEGTKDLAAALESNGAILVLAHMGNWELLTKCANWTYEGTPIGALYRPLNNPYINDLVLERREQEGMKLISSRNPAFTIFKLLKQKGIMCILSDQKIGTRGLATPFFGKITQCTRLPITLHEKGQAKVFTLSMQTLSAGRWKLKISEIETPTQKSIMNDLSEAMKTSLPDCFLFQDRWQGLPKKELIAEELTHEGHKKPLTVILESRELLETHPKMNELLPEELYTIQFWSEGANPAHAYCAIGNGSDFVKKCRKAGLKRGLIDPKRF